MGALRASTSRDTPASTIRSSGTGDRSLIVPASWTWLAPFLNLCKNDRSPKRPFELRETRYEKAAASAMVNLGAGYAVGYEGAIMIDGTWAADLAVDDLVALDGGTVLHAITARGTNTITLDRPLAAQLDDDNGPIACAAKTVQTVERLLVNGYQENKPGVRSRPAGGPVPGRSGRRRNRSGPDSSYRGPPDRWCGSSRSSPAG